MLEAQRKGFSFQISDGLSAALTIVENEKDGEPLLDAVMINMRAKNGAKKGSGCTYVKNLFEGNDISAMHSSASIVLVCRCGGHCHRERLRDGFHPRFRC